MQISKINSASFKGLWSIDRTEEKGYIKPWKSHIYYREAVYHPFSDETSKEIERQMDLANRSILYQGFPRNLQQGSQGDFYITKPRVGERLDITKKQYNQISYMKTYPDINSDAVGSEYIDGYHLTSIKQPQIEQIVSNIREEMAREEALWKYQE